MASLFSLKFHKQYKKVVATTLVYFRQGHRRFSLFFSWLLDNVDSQNKRRSSLWLAHYKKAANDFGSFEPLFSFKRRC